MMAQQQLEVVLIRKFRETPIAIFRGHQGVLLYSSPASWRDKCRLVILDVCVSIDFVVILPVEVRGPVSSMQHQYCMPWHTSLCL